MKKYRDNAYFGGNGIIVLKRDKYKCVKCGMTNAEHLKTWKCEITVDHIDGMGTYVKKKDRNNKRSNLQTLCLRCHGRKDRGIKGLSVKQVLDVKRRLHIGFSHKYLARIFGVSISHISQIFQGVAHSNIQLKDNQR